MRVGARSRTRGLSSLDAAAAGLLVCLAVAAVALFALPRPRDASLGRRRDLARKIATGRLEWLTAQTPAPRAACSGPVGCRLSPTALRPELASVPLPGGGDFHCSQHVGENDLADPTEASWVDGPYRLDTVIAPHPDAERHPEGRILTVSVCFTDKDGRIQEVIESRMLLPSAGG